MTSFDSKSLSAEAWLTLFAGLSLAACEKSAPAVAAEVGQAVASAAPRPSAAAKAGTVSAREVPSAASSAKAETEGGCAPGGCAPGKCGGAKKE